MLVLSGFVFALLFTAASCTAPLYGAEFKEAVEKQYLLVLNPEKNAHQFASVLKESILSAEETIFGVHEIGLFSALSVQINENTLNSLREKTDWIKYVQANVPVKLFDSQKGADWNLVRTSSNSETNHNWETGVYEYFPSAGEGVTVYVVDTGIYVQNEEFNQSRVSFAVDCSALLSPSCKTCGANGLECADKNGHGTHVSSTIAGKLYGLAKKATVVGVKVLGGSGSGTIFNIVNGIQYVTKDHQARGGKNRAKSVANMSLGTAQLNTAINDAVSASIKEGVVYAVAAGNDAVDACNTSPASTPDAITVLATTKEDTLAYFSNFGPCTDIGAPGYQIKGAWIGSPSETITISGTSMATPHVAGVIALYLGESSVEPDPAKVSEFLVKIGTKNVLQGTLPKGTPNVIAFSYQK